MPSTHAVLDYFHSQSPCSVAGLFFQKYGITDSSIAHFSPDSLQLLLASFRYLSEGQTPIYHPSIPVDEALKGCIRRLKYNKRLEVEEIRLSDWIETLPTPLRDGKQGKADVDEYSRTIIILLQATGFLMDDDEGLGPAEEAFFQIHDEIGTKISDHGQLDTACEFELDPKNLSKI
jgi:hypothetical protein